MWLQGQRKKYPLPLSPVTSVDIQQCMQIFAWNFTQLLNSKVVYTLSTSYVEIHLKITKLCCLNQDNLPYFWAFQALSSWVVQGGPKRAGLLAMRGGCRLGDRQSYCRCSVWPQLVVTAMLAIKRLVKFATALLMCSCGSPFQMVCKTTFNSSVVLSISWSLWYISSMASQTW